MYKNHQVDCALMDYSKEDAITTYMKHSLTETHQLPYDAGKFLRQNKNIECDVSLISQIASFCLLTDSTSTS